ncbi:hypothetical protein NSPZN2_11388 [Nitrospira defluvii]|uniref:Uncharacterized protein n=1 Tax=Nitrospira defluvii TaxID=330214 RepID=A0ABM8QTR2_9BACT|nr:hypothetical protein NSPZN2_11388 [Nitrospira defluvii]
MPRGFQLDSHRPACYSHRRRCTPRTIRQDSSFEEDDWFLPRSIGVTPFHTESVDEHYGYLRAFPTAIAAFLSRMARLCVPGVSGGTDLGRYSHTAHRTAAPD